MRVIINDLGVVTHSSDKREISIDTSIDINGDIDFTDANIIGLNLSGSIGATGATGPQGVTGATGATGNVEISGSHIVSIHVGPVIAAGTNQNDATVLPTGNFGYVCRSDSQIKGIVISNNHIVLGMCFIIINDDHSNNNFKLYPPVGGKLNNESVNIRIDVTAGKTLMLTCFDATIGASRWSVVGI